jgi:ANTAR domain
MPMPEAPSIPREALLARPLVELADTLVDDYDAVDLLTVLAGRCVEILAVAAAGVILVTPEGDLRVVASSSEAMRVLELFELQPDEGPCLDCYRTGEPVLNLHLPPSTGAGPLRAGGTRRWVPVGARPADAGHRHRRPQPVAGRRRATERGQRRRRPGAGRRGLHRHPPARGRARGSRPQRAAQRRAQQPGRIEQAKGVLAERAGLDVERAFTLLRNRPATTTFDSPPSPKASWTGPSSPERLAPRDPRAAPEPHGREVEWRSPGQDP